MQSLECNCGKTHIAPLESYVIECGAVNKLPEILASYRSVYMVCDQNTYVAAGERVERLLCDSGKLSHKYILPDGVLPDTAAVGGTLVHLHPPEAEGNTNGFSPLPDFILAVGSGTVNDICRLVSYRTHIPYGIVATAPSMDGYASAGSPILYGGTKATVKCTTPRYIIADLDIIKNAPLDMIKAGIGDMFGKYTGLLDWELARDFDGEYFCDNIAARVEKAANDCLDNGYLIKNRETKVIHNIFEGFMVTGLGMAYVGNSRPASGSEHIIAHAWELMSVEEGKKPSLHGLEVCEATLLVAVMYKRLYNETDDIHLKGLIEKYLPYFERVEQFCRDLEVPPATLDKAKILSGIKRALTLRDRYTILFYLRDKGLYDKYAEYAAEELVKFYEK
ncbi:MAG: sn-glycerol-1-phosphate dehydrogenase [Clostridia bacterium]|nr:sn-glycerol-1-phosphate dehydrogenase [Clostridia bacterium]